MKEQTSLENKMKHQKTSVTQMVAATFLALNLVATTLFAASGEGRSGNDETGVSIPVSMDRTVSVSDFDKAKKYCNIENRSALLEQIFRVKLSKDQLFDQQGNFRSSFCLNDKLLIWISNYKEDSYDLRNIYPLIQEGTCKMKPALEARQILNYPTFYSDQSHVLVSISVLEYLMSEFANLRSGLVSDTETIHFSGGPVASVTKSELNIDHADDLGSVNLNNYIVKEYKISDSPIARIIDNHKIPTKLALSIEKYRQCIEDQINK